MKIKICRTIRDFIKIVEVIFLIFLGILNYNMQKQVYHLQQEIKDLQCFRIRSQTISEYETALLYDFNTNQARLFKSKAEHIPGALNGMIEIAAMRYKEIVPKENYNYLSYKWEKFRGSESEVCRLFKTIEILNAKFLQIKVTTDRVNIREKPTSTGKSRIIGTIDLGEVLEVVDQQGQWFKVKVKQDQWYKEPLDAREDEGWVLNELVEIIVPDKFLKKL